MSEGSNSVMYCNKPDEVTAAYPYAISFPGISVQINADGSVTGDKEAFQKVLEELTCTAVMKQHSHYALTFAPLLLNAPWRQPSQRNK